MTAESEGSSERNWLRRISTAFRRHIRYKVTRSGYLFVVALVVVGGASVASGNNLLFLILAAMLATLMISGVVSRLCLAGLELELMLPEHLAARQKVSARLRLRNVKWFPSFAIELSSRATSGARIFDQQVTFPIIPGRSSLDVSAPTSFARRGLHHENLFTIATRFPFGFVERQAPVAIRTEVVVYPALEPSGETEELLNELRGEIEIQRRGPGSDFYRLRPYELYESARHVDWKSSAHTGELQVREFAREERPAISLYFDLRMSAGEEFERAVESCAYLVWSLGSEGVRIRFRTQTTDLRFPEETDLWTILRTLALLEPRLRAGVPAPDDEPVSILFSADPEAFHGGGWHVSRAPGTLF